MFILQNAPSEALTFGKAQLEPFLFDPGVSKFELTLSFTESGGKLWASMEYATALFDDPTVARMCGHIEHVLRAMVAQPTRAVHELPMLGHDERHRLLVEWNETSMPYPSDSTLDTLFEAQADRNPHAVALQSGSVQVSYADLNARANRLAHLLIERGIGPNTAVGVCMDRGVDLRGGTAGHSQAQAVPMCRWTPITRLNGSRLC